jgi:general secretion pathway protein I
MRIREAGFTLLEVMIAMAIMMLAFSSILMVQSSSLNTSEKAKNMNIVQMLARNLMIDTELEIRGKQFTDVKEEESGEFDAPYAEYKWKRAVKEIKFPELNISGPGDAGGTAGDQSAAAGGGGDDQGNTQSGEQLTRLLTQFLSKAVREVTVTVSWRRGSGEQSYSLSTYWVDLNHEFQLSE